MTNNSNQYIKCNTETQNEMINNSIQIGTGLPKIKSIMKCGNIYLYSTKTFNKFQKYMWKIFFGVDIYEKNKGDNT